MPQSMGAIAAVRYNGVEIATDIITADLIRYEMLWGPPSPDLTVPEQARLAWVIARRMQRTGQLEGIPDDFDAFLDGVDFPAVDSVPKDAAPPRRQRTSSQK